MSAKMTLRGWQSWALALAQRLDRRLLGGRRWPSSPRQTSVVGHLGRWPWRSGCDWRLLGGRRWPSSHAWGSFLGRLHQMGCIRLRRMGFSRPGRANEWGCEWTLHFSGPRCSRRQSSRFGIARKRNFAPANRHVHAAVRAPFTPPSISAQFPGVPFICPALPQKPHRALAPCIPSESGMTFLSSLFSHPLIAIAARKLRPGYAKSGLGGERELTIRDGELVRLRRS